MRTVRIYVEKKPGYALEAKHLHVELEETFHIQLQELRILNLYDVFHISEETLAKAKQTIFAEVMVDEVMEEVNTSGYHQIAYEYLPGQYDQRADSAMQCLQLLDDSQQSIIRSGKLVLYKGTLAPSQHAAIKQYLINPVEAREKQMNQLLYEEHADVLPLASYDQFLHLNKQQLEQFRADHQFGFHLADLLHIQAYFKEEEQRNPTETELRVLDTYWSDHCRHTTFETILTEIHWGHGTLQTQIQEAFQLYLQKRVSLQREEKPMTLMDLATIGARHASAAGKLERLEVSEEINACSVLIEVDHDGNKEPWLLMFKNETHNHPTEIEPFGGASTCIGGAIRDPLSGRSYVYQAMRISGSGNILADIQTTRNHKLPQKTISAKATQGYSSYGNQIGLATTFTKELFADGFVAKHLECGAVVGANHKDHIVRASCAAGDVVLLLGGRTGRDGIGGATGSSKEHTAQSLELCASEVQKGNAVEERKIQRLFRNPAATKLIKKCNDFGAGGVCVAIGELADGLEIQLDQVRTKYAGLNATELAISESQERMAVVVAPNDAEQFIQFAEQENLEAYVVAMVNDTNRLRMTMHGEVVVDLSRDFMNTNGVRQETAVLVEGELGLCNPFVSGLPLSEETVLQVLSRLDVCSQKGMQEQFDASIGSTTVLMPYSGKYQLTPAQASVQKLPVLDGRTTTCSILTYGYYPQIAEFSPYLSAVYAVIDSLAKVIAVGGSLQETYLSFQEYFEKLEQDPKKWGKAVQALLGSIAAQEAFEVYAIGGKDSMSGTYQELTVPPTLISFACSVGHTKRIKSNHLKQAGNYLYLVKPKMDETFVPDFASFRHCFALVEQELLSGNIVAAGVVSEGGIIAQLVRMAAGNRLGFQIQYEGELFGLMPGAFLVETNKEIVDSAAILLGHVTEAAIQINGLQLDSETVFAAYLNPLQTLYPFYGPKADASVYQPQASGIRAQLQAQGEKEVNVLIPVFPGSNCEYDTKRAFEEEGAVCEILVFKNQSAKQTMQSIEAFAKAIANNDIIAFPGGFSSGDEPDGSAKFIVNVLLNETIKEAIHTFLDRNGLILGICNGFQALIKSGLLPYGRIQPVTEESPTLFRNDIGRHVSTMVQTRVASNHSPWLSSFAVGEVHTIPVSHGEGKFICNQQQMTDLFASQQVAFQYCDLEGNATMDPAYNINGSIQAVEGLVSADGHILGKMGHSERYCEDVFTNIEGTKKQAIFANGCRYVRSLKQ